MTKTNYDSEFCGGLPIHLINLIQPYGVLVVVDKQTRHIIQVSENAAAVFDVGFADLVNTPIANYVSADVDRTLEERFEQGSAKVPALWEINGRTYLTLIHNHDRFFVIEIDLAVYEEKEQNSFVKVYQEIKYAMSVIQAADSVKSAAETCARELKRITGYDKVMVYGFDDDWNGTVIAEQMEPGMDSYLGITFPASDVPQQARMLYQQNPFRLIPTRDYQPVKLYPVINPITGSFIDLSACNLRSVAGVHLEYLKNMNVMASMSARVMSGERLWGLIACHHREPKMLSFEISSVVEMLSNILSSKITALQRSDLHDFNMRLKEQYKNIIEDAYRQNDLPNALLNGSPDVLELFNVQGAVVALKGKMRSKGAIPPPEHLRELLLWINARELKQVYYTDCLGDEYEDARHYADVASGLMVIPVDHETDEYILLFRSEVVQLINWGGNPDERIRFVEGSKNYHPRASFRKWQQHVKGVSPGWRGEEILAAENLRSFIYEYSN